MGGKYADEPDMADLADAIDELRNTLERAWENGHGRKVRFRPEPVELTVQVGLTRSSKGRAGLQWKILVMGGERSRQTALTHTLTIRLTPVLAGANGQPEGELIISDID